MVAPNPHVSQHLFVDDCWPYYMSVNTDERGIRKTFSSNETSTPKKGHPVSFFCTLLLI